MATSDFYNVEADAVCNVYRNKGRTHDSVEVTVTATMKNGSILADGVEIAAADAATGNQILDMTTFNGMDYEIGDVVVVPVIVRESTVIGANLKFSDVAYTSQTLTILSAAGVVIK